MSEVVIIRPFVRSDQTAARRIILDGLGEHFGWVDETRNPDLDDIVANYVRRGHTFVVATIGGEVVGTGALQQEAAGVGRIVRLSVAPSQRRKGIGQALVAHLVALARHRGYRRIVVETNHDWVDAIRLYERCGFMPYDRDDESIHMALTLKRGEGADASY